MVETPDQTSERGARIVYLALFAATLVIAALLVGLRERLPAIGALLPPLARAVFRVVILAIAGAATMAARVLGSTLPPRNPRDQASWWAANGGRAIVLWVFGEAVGVAGAALYFVSGDLLVLAIGAGWAAALLVWYGPNRLGES